MTPKSRTPLKDATSRKTILKLVRKTIMDEFHVKKYLASFSEEKKLCLLHSFFQGKLNTESMKLMKTLIRCNKNRTNKNSFENILDSVDPEFFTQELQNDVKHYKLDFSASARETSFSGYHKTYRSLKRAKSLDEFEDRYHAPTSYNNARAHIRRRSCQCSF